MPYNMASVFSLQGLKVDTITTTEATVTLKVRSPRTHALCPRCGLTSRVIHQKHRRIVSHGQLNDKLILVQVKVRRFRCAKCCKPFTEYLPGISRKRSTDHCLNARLQDAAAMSMRAVAKRHGAAAATVMNQVDDIRYEIDWDTQGQHISLGLDEHSLRKQRQMVTTITNLTKGKRSLLTILPNDKKETIVKFLKQSPVERICEVCIDLRGSFRSAIEEALPGVHIVADPFHVVQLCGRAVEEVRQIVLSACGNQARVKRALLKPQEKLTDEEKHKLGNLWADTEAWPQLKVAYLVKEKIRDMYKSRNRASAERKFTIILAQLEGTQSKPLSTLKKTLLKWQPQILNHFDRGTSNGFTEGCHTKIKMLKRMSYGFTNRQRYRNKILLAFHPLSVFGKGTLN